MVHCADVPRDLEAVTRITFAAMKSLNVSV